jgi:predicted PurR-regulated permease PerM
MGEGGSVDDERGAAPSGGASVGIGIGATIAVLLVLYFARAFFLPIAFAFALNALFRPIVRRLGALRFPAPAGATIVVLTLIALMVGAVFALTRPMKGWMAKAPETFDAAEKKLSRVRGPVQQVTGITQRIEHATQMAATAPATQPTTQPDTGATRQGGSAPPPAQPSEPQPVTPTAAAPQGPGLLGGVLGTTTSFLGGLLEVIVLLYLLLASDDLFFRKLLKVMPTRQDKRDAADVVAEAESVVLRYVGVTALINVCQAAMVGLMLWWLKVPSPWLWALGTFVLEFIPYLGATIMILLLSVVAFATFDDTWRILAPGGGYLLITTIQNNIVSPYAYGDRLKLNPVAVLIGVLFWWFVWGIGGAFLAVPIIATIKIVTAHTKSFNAVAEFLGE